jgi:hypothetical protein
VVMNTAPAGAMSAFEDLRIVPTETQDRENQGRENKGLYGSVVLPAHSFPVNLA